MAGITGSGYSRLKSQNRHGPEGEFWSNMHRGTLIAVPVVNVYAFEQHSRYSPDRRGLNRFFPGSKNGSLTFQLADTFMSEVVRDSQYGIDLHAGSNHR